MTDLGESSDRPPDCPICGEALVAPLMGGSEISCTNCGHVVWFSRRLVDGTTVLDVRSGTVAINTDIERVSKSLLVPEVTPNVILNLSSLKFISSAFVAGMIALQKRVRVAGGRLILCGMHPIVRETLHGARLDTFFDIQETEQDALQSL